MREAWNGAPDSLRADLVQSIVMFVELYHDIYDRNRLIERLSESNPTWISAVGKADKSLKGKKKYVKLIYRIYNGKSKKDALPVKF